LRGIVQFCIERHMIHEAFDFALHNGRALLSDAIGSAKQVAEELAVDSISGHKLELLHEVPITDIVRERVNFVSPLAADSLVPLANMIGVHSIQPGITVLKAAGVCPPETRSVRAVATVDTARSLFLAVAVVA